VVDNVDTLGVQAGLKHEKEVKELRRAEEERILEQCRRARRKDYAEVQVIFHKGAVKRVVFKETI
jgi:hypothetical protein